MTDFNIDKFRWDGMYLTYEGDQGALTKYYEQPCHPTREGLPKAAFIARFKYGSKPWKTWAKFLTKHFTVEEYLTRLEAGEGPLTVLESKGFVQPHIKKELKKRGYPQTVAGFKQMIKDQVEARAA